MMWKGDASTHARYVDRSLLVKMGWSISINPSKIFLLFYNKKPTFSILHDYFATSDHLLYTLFPLNNNIFLFYFYSFPTSQVRTLSLSLSLISEQMLSLSNLKNLRSLQSTFMVHIWKSDLSTQSSMDKHLKIISHFLLYFFKFTSYYWSKVYVVNSLGVWIG